MTASAIGNMPEKDLDAVKEMVIRGVMHADEHLFAFKVSARGLSAVFVYRLYWLGFGPNSDWATRKEAPTTRIEE